MNELNKTTPALSYAAKDIIKYLGNLIRLARKEMKITDEELAERVNVCRTTIRKVQCGDVTLSIGTYFEAALILGIPILGGKSKRNLNRISTLVSEIHQLLPEHTKGTGIQVDDDF